MLNRIVSCSFLCGHLLVQGRCNLWGSELLLLETLVKPIREQDAALEISFRHILAHSDLRLIPISRPILERAGRLRAASKIHTPDAIHAATALSLNCTTFLSNDKGFRRVEGLPVQLLSEIVAG